MIALVDCNNFFASCERLFRPDLKGVPVLVLSNNDGCVVARSNEVKELGIPMGVPYFQVKELVEKNGVQCFSSNFPLYSNMSQRVLGVLQRHAPQIEVYSIDEAFMELSKMPVSDFQAWGDRLQYEVQRDVGMPVSVGVAPSKTLAKMASAYAKKHQQTCVLDPRVDQSVYQAVLSEAEVGSVWGVGRRLAPRFLRAGIHTALQLSKASPAWMYAQLGITGTRMLAELNGGVAYPFDEEKVLQKSLMASRSFGHTIKSTHELETAVASFASQAAFRLRKHQQVTSSFGLYLRFRVPDGSTNGQSVVTKFATPTNDTAELVGAALQLMEQIYDPEHGYKKAGVFANHLTSSNVCQVDLLDFISPATRTKKQQFMRAVDSINERYGKDAIHIGAIDPKATRWHARKERMSPAYTTDWSQLPRLYRYNTRKMV